MMLQATSGDCCPDFVVVCQDFVCTGHLQDAILNSINMPTNSNECCGGGWWYRPNEGNGSVNLIGTASSADERLRLTKEYTLQSLRWLIADGIASEVDVVTIDAGQGSVCIEITVTRPDGCTGVLSVNDNDIAWVWETDNG